MWLSKIDMLAAVSAENQMWIGAVLGIMFLVLIIGVIVVVVVRKRALNSSGSTTEGFSLEGLQKMHAQGLISDEEYKQMKDHFIADFGSA